METIQGYTPEWKTIRIDLQNWTDKNVLIAFEFTTEPDSGGSSISDGWWIREIVVFESHETIYFEDFSGYDINDPWDDWTIVLHMGLVNAPPSAPTISGETNGKVGTNYNYTFTSTDPDGDQVSYHIDWGDGDTTDWTAFQASGPPGYSEGHAWDEQDEYTIIAKAKDENGLVGPEATLIVTMPRNKPYINTPFQWFLQHLPNLFPILKTLLQRLGLQ